MSAFCSTNDIWTSTCMLANTTDQDYISGSEEFIITSATPKAIELQTLGQSNQLQSSYLHYWVTIQCFASRGHSCGYSSQIGAGEVYNSDLCVITKVSLECSCHFFMPPRLTFYLPQVMLVSTMKSHLSLGSVLSMTPVRLDVVTIFFFFCGVLVYLRSLGSISLRSHNPNRRCKKLIIMMYMRDHKTVSFSTTSSYSEMSRVFQLSQHRVHDTTCLSLTKV